MELPYEYQKKIILTFLLKKGIFESLVVWKQAISLILLYLAAYLPFAQETIFIVTKNHTYFGLLLNIYEFLKFLLKKLKHSEFRLSYHKINDYLHFLLFVFFRTAYLLLLKASGDHRCHLPSFLFFHVFWDLKIFIKFIF